MIPADDAVADSRMKRLYAAVIVSEVAVITALWLLGRVFG
jgi:hypothetical protein